MVFSLDWTQYDMMNEGTILNLYFEFSSFLPKPLLRAEFRISPRTLAEEKRKPNPQNICSAFPSPFWISTLVERGRNIKIKKKVERKISSFDP